MCALDAATIYVTNQPLRSYSSSSMSAIIGS